MPSIDPPAPTVVDFSRKPDGFAMRRLYRQTRPDGATFEIGHACVPAGTRMPPEGDVALPVDDIGIVFEGRIDGVIGGAAAGVDRHHFVLTPENVPQSGTYPLATEMAYVFFGGEVSADAVPRPAETLPIKAGPITVWSRHAIARAGGVTPIARLHSEGETTLEVTYAFAPAGMVMPAEGGIALPAHDMEIFLSGRAEAIVGGERVLISAGDIVYIPPGASQWVRFLEDSELLCFFFGDAVTLPDFDEAGTGA